ncbi:Major facilitator family transporter [Acidisarcina polymorpha]|uniref:Major facilitator family transporter n=1 Tax=Acidisarcina polymorpha TaxID=2211140 RepID=A0A2Z5G068_9BACT|nr:MFS transporter [Acidisarcina polymorpha]AXC12518.1 Major facilitator family transporter [Acidisarcina polymorpha]
MRLETTSSPTSDVIESDVIESDIPARLDRLPWSRWHQRVIAALAVTWLLDGLEGSLGGSLAGALKSSQTLSLSDSQLGLSSSFYLAGAVGGALIFGHLADRYGRRKLFSGTLLLYLCATAATGLSWNLLSFTICRVLTGAGIGGEYAAINSAVDELVPARLRGRVDLWINATFWLGIIVGSLVSILFLSPKVFGLALGWRLAFCSGVPLGIVVIVMRRYIPESPRWLLSRGALQEAEVVVTEIESSVATSAAGRGNLFPSQTPPLPSALTQVQIQRVSSLRQLARILSGPYRRRALLGFSLMAAQAFFYNSVFFSLALVLLRYYGVDTARIGYCFIPIACTNFLGPVVLGRFFDTIGRRQMIAATYCFSGLSLLGSSWLFYLGKLSVISQLVWWALTFFFASSAASSAYLTVSEVFPQEVRASCIALFYAFGTLAGGLFGPLIFGHLIGGQSRGPLLSGYVLGAAVMIAAGLAQARWGVAAERQSLEAIAASAGNRERSERPLPPRNQTRPASAL